MRRLIAMMTMVLTVVSNSAYSVQINLGDEDMAAKLKVVRVPFLMNNGQAPESVISYAQTFAGRVSVMRDGSWTYSLPNYADQIEPEQSQLPPMINNSQAEEIKSPRISGWVVLNESLYGAKSLAPRPQGETPAQVSIFRGSDPSQWQGGLSSWKQMDMGEVYDGISLTLIAHGNNIEKIFTVSPGADPAKIELGIEGGSGASVSESEELVIETELGPVSFTVPVAYQNTPRGRTDIQISYSIDESGARYGFTLGDFNASLPLIIDPLISSTYIGGSGQDMGKTVVEAANGDIIVGGNSYSANYPVTTGAIQSANIGARDIVISRFNSTLTALTSSTYIGGSGDDQVSSMIEAGNGDIIVVGISSSTNYPGTAGAFQSAHGGGYDDIIVSRLNSSLTALTASTYLGGSHYDYGYSVVEATNGNIIVTGTSAGSGYPVTAGAFRTGNAGGYDTVVSRLNSVLSSLIASTYIGGSSQDFGKSVVEATNGDIIVGGKSYSSNYPVTAGAYQNSRSGNYDNCVSRFNSALTSLSASTYIGGLSPDECVSIAEAANGDIIIVGFSSSTNYPVTTGAFQTVNAGAVDVVISRFGSSLTNLTASTYIGGSSDDKCYALVEAVNGDLIVAGTSASINYPVTSGAFQIARAGNSDMIISRFSSTLSTLAASTYIGGSSVDECYSMAESTNGDIIIAGYSGSSDYPVTAGSFQNTYAGGGDIVLSRIKSSLTEGSLAIPNDYNGDGASDLAVLDQGTGRWFIRTVAGSQLGFSINWGWPGVEGVAGDYDGDGLADLAVFDQGTGRWFVRALSGSTIVWENFWGWSGVRPVAGDYDGDGVYDLAILDQGTGRWFIKKTDNTILGWSLNWGWAGVEPVSGDYDGDGLADLAVFDQNTGRWFIRAVSGTQIAFDVNWGWPGVDPVAGDYDGDGKSDLAIFDQNTGRWFIRAVDGTQLAWDVNWGWPGVRPVSGDYDGDGADDLAIFDEATGRWFIRNLSGTTIAWDVNWGWPGVQSIGR